MAEIVRAWAADHQATVSLWDFSLPAVRATAKHPAGGMACVECEVQGDGQASVAAMYWRDDYEEGIRRGWTHSFGTSVLSSAPLIELLDEAVGLLLEPRELTSYRETRIEHAAESAAAMRAWENDFGVLR